MQVQQLDKRVRTRYEHATQRCIARGISHIADKSHWYIVRLYAMIDFIVNVKGLYGFPIKSHCTRLDSRILNE